MTQGGMAVLAGLCLSTSVAWAQTQDALPPNAEMACESAGLRGSAPGRCRAWGETLDCGRKEVMLGTGQRQQQVCAQLEANFRRAFGGRELAHIFGVATVPPEGGSATLENVASATFPPGAFPQTTYVRVFQTRSEELDALFRDTAALYAPLLTTSEQLHINTGLTPPVSDTVTVQVRVPEKLLAATPSGYAVQLFAQVHQGSADDGFHAFELFSSTYDPATQTLTAQLPTAVFSDGPTTSAEQEAVLVLAPVRGAWQEATSEPSSPRSAMPPALVEEAPTCTTPLICPVVGGCTVTSSFQAVRKHPILGVGRPHLGVDYRAATGTGIVAAAGGQIELSYTSGTFGNTVIIRHGDGSATLYAHLSERSVSEGDTVSAGQPIGRAGNTGLSKGPHLHFEYVPDGPIIRSPRRMDPNTCMEVPCDELNTGLVTYLALSASAQRSQFDSPKGSEYQGPTPTSLTANDSGSCGPDTTVSGTSSAAAYAVSAQSEARNCGINTTGSFASTATTLDFSRCAVGAEEPVRGELSVQLDTELQTTSNPGLFRQAVTSVDGSVNVSHPGGEFGLSGNAGVTNGPYEYSWSNYGLMSGMPEHGGSKSITVPITLKPGQTNGMQVRVSAIVSSGGLSLEPAAKSSVSIKLSGVSLFDANGNKLSNQCVCAK